MTIIKEAKQVGVLYHITSISSLIKILNSNKLLGAINGVSFTRNKLLYKTATTLGGNQCQLIIDGNKLSEKYKIYSYKDSVSSQSDESEETVNIRVIDNISKYILKIQLIKPSSWTFKRQDQYFINRSLKKDLDDEISLLDIQKFIKSFTMVEVI